MSGKQRQGRGNCATVVLVGIEACKAINVGSGEATTIGDLEAISGEGRG